MGTLLEELGLETETDEWSIPAHADGTKADAAIPFSGLFDGPEIAAPFRLHDLT